MKGRNNKNISRISESTASAWILQTVAVVEDYLCFDNKKKSLVLGVEGRVVGGLERNFFFNVQEKRAIYFDYSRWCVFSIATILCINIGSI